MSRVDDCRVWELELSDLIGGTIRMSSAWTTLSSLQEYKSHISDKKSIKIILVIKRIEKTH